VPVAEAAQLRKVTQAPRRELEGRHRVAVAVGAVESSHLRNARAGGRASVMRPAPSHKIPSSTPSAESGLGGEHDELGPVTGIELEHGSAHVGAYGVGAEHQFLGNFAV
jgi:hypothetical protein